MDAADKFRLVSVEAMLVLKGAVTRLKKTVQKPQAFILRLCRDLAQRLAARYLRDLAPVATAGF